MDFKKLHSIFIEESQERLAELESGLLQLERTPDDKELLNTIFRAAHTIKGSSGTLGLKDISKFTHNMEEILDLMREGRLSPHKEIINTLLDSTDLIKEMVESVASDTVFDFTRCNSLVERMEEIRAGDRQVIPIIDQDIKGLKTTPASSELRTFRIIFIPPQDLFKRGIDPAIILDDLKKIGTVANINADTNNIPPLKDFNPENLYLKWDICFKTDKDEEEIRKVFEFVEDGSKIKIIPASSTQKDMPLIGKMLVEEGVVSPKDIEEALRAQKKLGEILVEQGKATPLQIEKVLKKQEGIKSESFKSSVSSTIRVDLEKLDRLINIVGEMVIINSMFQQLVSDKQETAGDAKITVEQLNAIFSQLTRVSKDIQENTMSLRMLPVGDVFRRFDRLVRELSVSENKKIQLVMSGEETELDKGVLEKITDPLVHLIRNSIDHGIEAPKERLLKGKTETAIIHLTAYQLGNSVYIDVEDDGRGLNKEKILEKAVSRGIINGNKELTDEEIYNLIFLPGFSTADRVTDVSGRGVGMDVVKRNIESLNGSVFIRTRHDAGTTISIKLPLTLAIIDGITVLIGNETFVVPMASVVESIRPRKEDVQTIAEKEEVVNVRGEFIPLIRLYETMNIMPGKKEPWDGIVVIVGTENGKYCLMADEILGQQQVVIKNLGRAMPKVSSVAGGTILGNGMVALVLDVHGVVEKGIK